MEGDGAAPDRPGAGSRTLRELSGAFADLGTFLPLVLGAVLVSGLDATGVLVGFGGFAIAVAVIYRRPVPVQPMKAVAAIAIAGALTPGTVAAAGLLIGLSLTVLALCGALERAARVVPQSVLAGVQVGIGLTLALHGLELMGESAYLGAVCLVLLLALLRTAAAGVAALLLLAGATAWSIATGAPLAWAGSLGELSLPALVLPTTTELATAAERTLLPQLPLTLANAVLATAAIAATLFPDGSRSITPRRLGLTSGVLNVILAPMGALPMCHGAGGLVTQHRFGARTGLAPLIFGATCLALGLLFGPRATEALSIIPLAALGALLTFAGLDLVATRRLFDGRPRCLAVILATAVVAVVTNAAYGLVVGLALELGWTATQRALQLRARP
ncbi:MAG: sulfate transporter [Gammaproteobacteria bacterium]|nr:sulfate transporter [Gammaproteobacteria bacterium]NIR82831.1 sulfate transporter [Gammaproteobacteria bacterium]NIR89940.1 sulfate transporter [Gammaproteobacteria bacterium]NIU03989.1 sulfate transporter [Gammaproteobacteria bacterium]NIV51309.1 sulfate transporter [Gammaproteobacteria bacterium]